MTMARLADTITVSIGGEAIQLRPSLRFAIRLERRPGSFARLARDVFDGSLTAAIDIIRDHYDHPMLETLILDSGFDRLREPLTLYIMALAGMDPEARTEAPDDAKAVSFGEFLEDLFKKAAGWLGWEPDVALDATPAEIMLAMEGRMDMLKAIFGSADDQDTPESKMSLDDKFRTVFSSFGTTKFTKRKEANS
ncbi:hypothetical protein NA2_11650 [Nitratireductor pacificus pht-3B]|uniref:Tail assembly chaperone n=2 Tax=Nitratireductor TaxID=245876 RepID=K2M9M4_9HYPH|nr:hypothetical protein NA2_11650 [Nitratireductor pacificus pht-3B]